MKLVIKYYNIQEFHTIMLHIILILGKVFQKYFKYKMNKQVIIVQQTLNRLIVSNSLFKNENNILGKNLIELIIVCFFYIYIRFLTLL